MIKKSPVMAPTDRPANKPDIVPSKIVTAKLVSAEGIEAPKKIIAIPTVQPSESARIHLAAFCACFLNSTY